MDTLASVISKVLKKRGLEAEARAAHVVYLAQKKLMELLPGFQGFLTAQTCTRGVLIIEASHPIAAQECQAVKEPLIAFLRREFGEVVVTEIRIMRSKKENPSETSDRK